MRRRGRGGGEEEEEKNLNEEDTVRSPTVEEDIRRDWSLFKI